MYLKIWVKGCNFSPELQSWQFFAELTSITIKVSLLSIQIHKSLTFSSLITMIIDTSTSTVVFELVKLHLSIFSLRKCFVNRSKVLSIPPLNCQRTDTWWRRIRIIVINQTCKIYISSISKNNHIWKR